MKKILIIIWVVFVFSNINAQTLSPAYEFQPAMTAASYTGVYIGGESMYLQNYNFAQKYAIDGIVNYKFIPMSLGMQSIDFDITTQQYFYINFSPKVKISQDSYLSLGIRSSYSKWISNKQAIVLENNVDPILINNVEGVFDMNIGLLLFKPDQYSFGIFGRELLKDIRTVGINANYIIDNFGVDIIAESDFDFQQYLITGVIGYNTSNYGIEAIYSYDTFHNLGGVVYLSQNNFVLGFRYMKFNNINEFGVFINYISPSKTSLNSGGLN